MRIGIDVGGTNTDAVAMQAGTVLAEYKHSTTPDISSGIFSALTSILAEAGDPGQVTAVMIGTTHFTNAVAQARDLLPVAAVRLGLPATKELPPLTAWPAALHRAVGDNVYVCSGGHEFDGREIAPLDRDELKRVAEDIAAKRIRAIALTSVFSPTNDEMEHEAAEILKGLVPDAAISLSSEVGRLGLLERENATIINASLADLAVQATEGFRQAIQEAGISAPVYVSQNDGTLMNLEYVERYPVNTFASGPANSMRGAAFLSGSDDCAVVDIGGTTSDIGILQGGFPREAGKAIVSIGGVRTNFRMPDVLSLAIGGGSIVAEGGEHLVGPTSVGYRLAKRALVFGGDTFTATDAAVAMGRADIGRPENVDRVDKALAERALASISTRIADTVDRMKVSAAEIPAVVVGGGGILLPDTLPGLSKLVRPDHFAVANAIGATIAQVSGTVDQLFSIDSHLTRERAVARATEMAAQRAVDAGAAADTVEIVDVEERALAYVPGNALRIRVKAVGSLLDETS